MEDRDARCIRVAWRLYEEIRRRGGPRPKLVVADYIYNTEGCIFSGLPEKLRERDDIDVAELYAGNRVAIRQEVDALLLEKDPVRFHLRSLWLRAITCGRSDQ